MKHLTRISAFGSSPRIRKGNKLLTKCHLSTAKISYIFIGLRI